ncbi:MAG TPA: ribosome recycling factor [Coxiellaceae bacterium]|nr:ribosome recycling factor [Coxiellaceae bacterium]
MIADIKQDAKKRMEKSIVTLNTNLSKLRTGRAHPSLLDHITVNYYDVETPLNQVANIHVEGARTLSLSPWDKKMIPQIEKAILKSDLGLNPTTAGDVVRISMPALTEQRRLELVKVLKGEGEEAKVAIRNVRRDANEALKDLLKEKMISEDEERRAHADIQKITDDFIVKVDEMLKIKETELMTL